MSSEPEDSLNSTRQTADFQQRILAAQKDSRDRQLEDSIFNQLNEDDNIEELRKKVQLLEGQVDRMENHIGSLENKLRDRKRARQQEAGLTNMTPEERAQFVMDEEERGQEDMPDLDVIFEYMLLVGSSATNDTNDLSQTDFLISDNELRKEAMLDQEVLQQSEYSFIKFTVAKNRLETQIDSLDDVRHCELSGTSFNENFTITFDVLEPSMTMCNLEYKVGIRLKIALGPLLEKIRESCNILGFFQAFVHYARLEDQRKSVFEKLLQTFKNTLVFAESLSDSRIKFQGSREDTMCLVLEWKIIVDTRGGLEANVRDHIKPQLNMDVIAPSEWQERDQNNVLDKVNQSYTDLLLLQGVFKATETIVNKMLI